jgi:hypothetical protein
MILGTRRRTSELGIYNSYIWTSTYTILCQGHIRQMAGVTVHVSYIIPASNLTRETSSTYRYPCCTELLHSFIMSTSYCPDLPTHTILVYGLQSSRLTYDLKIGIVCRMILKICIFIMSGAWFMPVHIILWKTCFLYLRKLASSHKRSSQKYKEEYGQMFPLI